MASFGHKVTPLEQHQRAGVFRNPIWSRCNAGKRRPNPGCQKPVQYVCEYAYVTGRAGRVSTNEKGRCREHAQHFANRHQIDGPDELDTDDDHPRKDYSGLMGQSL